MNDDKMPIIKNDIGREQINIIEDRLDEMTISSNLKERILSHLYFLD